MTINSTAMVDADVRIVFPPTNGLRLANFEVLDNGLQSVAINQPTTQYLGDGSLEILMDVVYNLKTYLWRDSSILILPPKSHNLTQVHSGLPHRLHLVIFSCILDLKVLSLNYWTGYRSKLGIR